MISLNYIKTISCTYFLFCQILFLIIIFCKVNSDNKSYNSNL